MVMSLDLAGLAGPPRYVVSPLVELGWAWHAMVSDHHRPGTEAPHGLRGELVDWSFLVRAVRATFLADPTLLPGSTWDEQLDGLVRLPAAEFTAAVLRPLARANGRPVVGPVGVLGLARARGSATQALVRLVLDEPETARGRLVGLLAACWNGFFADQWDRVGQLLAAEADRAAERGWRGVAELSPTITVDGTRLVIDKIQNKRLVAAGRGLVLLPTVLGGPHVYVADEPGRPVVLHYPVPAPPAAADSRATLRRLTALAHPARLEICRAIAVEPRSAREIALLWGMAEPAVTKHLSALRSAGLVRTERAGHFLRYALNDTDIAGLGADLLEVLRR
ncbi:DUF5937 family protein [Longispora urticae]